MTYEEINNLTVEDVKTFLIERLRMKRIEPEQLIDPPIEIIDPNYPPSTHEYSNSQLEDELILYKVDLTDIEDERLRILDLENRYKLLISFDPGLGGFHTYRNSIDQRVSNAAIYFRDEILNNPNKEEAEANLALMEQKEIEYRATVTNEADIARQERLEAKQAWKELKQSTDPNIRKLVKVLRKTVRGLNDRQ